MRCDAMRCEVMCRRQNETDWSDWGGATIGLIGSGQYSGQQVPDTRQHVRTYSTVDAD